MTSKKKGQPGLFKRRGVSTQHQTIFLTTLPETNRSKQNIYREASRGSQFQR